MRVQGFSGRFLRNPCGVEEGRHIVFADSGVTVWSKKPMRAGAFKFLGSKFVRGAPIGKKDTPYGLRFGYDATCVCPLIDAAWVFESSSNIYDPSDLVFFCYFDQLFGHNPLYSAIGIPAKAKCPSLVWRKGIKVL